MPRVSAATSSLGVSSHSDQTKNFTSIVECPSLSGDLHQLDIQLGSSHELETLGVSPLADVAVDPLGVISGKRRFALIQESKQDCSIGSDIHSLGPLSEGGSAGEKSGRAPPTLPRPGAPLEGDAPAEKRPKMNLPPLSLMQLVLWLVILSTFCYTWLSSEPFLTFGTDPTEGGSPPEDIAAVSSGVGGNSGLAEGVQGIAADSLKSRVVGEEPKRENSVKLEVSPSKVLGGEVNPAEVSKGGFVAERGGPSEVEITTSANALDQASRTAEKSAIARGLSKSEVSTDNLNKNIRPTEGSGEGAKQVKDAPYKSEKTPIRKEPGVDSKLLGDPFAEETRVTNPQSEVVGNRVNEVTRPAEEPGCFHHPATGIEKVIGDYIRETGCPITFFLFWTTTSAPNKTAKSDGFQMRHLRSVESAFVTHPSACVIFLSVLKFENRFMSELQTRGFRLLILDEFDVTSLLKYTPAEVWYKRVDEWRKGKYFFSHFTDLMRLAVLYKFGGVYIDTDCIVMNDVTDVRNAFGAQLTDGDTGAHKEVDGGVMMFDRGSSFLYECMVEASGNYNQWDWEFNGPGLLKRMLARADLEGSYTVVPTMAIYPIYYRDIWAYFDVNGKAKSADEQAAFWARMRNETRVFHWYNQFALKHRAAEGSLMRAAFNEYCIFCEEVVE